MRRASATLRLSIGGSASASLISSKMRTLGSSRSLRLTASDKETLHYILKFENHPVRSCQRHGFTHKAPDQLTFQVCIRLRT